jgi:hypothetical protein
LIPHHALARIEAEAAALTASHKCRDWLNAARRIESDDNPVAGAIEDRQRRFLLAVWGVQVAVLNKVVAVDGHAMYAFGIIRPCAQFDQIFLLPSHALFVPVKRRWSPSRTMGTSVSMGRRDKPGDDDCPAMRRRGWKLNRVHIAALSRPFSA